MMHPFGSYFPSLNAACSFHNPLPTMPDLTGRDTGVSRNGEAYCLDKNEPRNNNHPYNCL